MKIFSVFVLSLFLHQGAFASQINIQTVCGVFHSRPSGGMAGVMTPWLEVAKGQSFYLSSAAQNIQESQTRADMINRMTTGSSYCVSGFFSTVAKYTLQIIPTRIEPTKPIYFLN